MLDAVCLILAGGKGKRLSPEKPLLEIEGQPIIARVVDVVSRIFPEVLLMTNSPEKFAFLGLPCIQDETRGCGPLMGIYSGLKHSSREVAFVCAADMPFLQADIIRAQYQMVDDFDMVIPYPNRLPEFLHTFYRARLLPKIAENLLHRRYKIDLLREDGKVLLLEDEWFSDHGFGELKAKAFVNINTPEEYKRWAGGGGSPTLIPSF